MAVPQGILGALQNSPFANSIRKVAQPIDNGYRGPTQMGPQAELEAAASLVGNRERVDPYKGTRFEGFTGLGNDGYGSMSQGPMDNILADGFFVNDPRRPRPGMRGSSDSGIPAIQEPFREPTQEELTARLREINPGMIMGNQGDVRSGSPNSISIASDGFGNILKQLPERGMMDILTSYMNDYSTPEERLQTARGRMMSRDVKSKAENDALMYITQNQGDINQDRLDFLKYRQSIRPTFGTSGVSTMEVRPGEISFDEFMKQGKPNSYTGGNGIGGYLGISDQPGAGELLNPILKDATGMPDPRGPVDPGFSPNLMGAGRRPQDPYARPQPGMFPQPVEINPNFRPNVAPDRPNPNMYQRPMRRPFGFGGRRPMNPFMGMGLGMMNPMGMGMFGGFPMRPPMFGGFGGGYGGGFGGRPMMGYGLGAANPYGMSPYSNFGRPTPYSQPSYSRPNPYQQPYNRPNPYSSGMNLRPPSFGGGQPSQPSYMPVMQQQPQQQQPQYNNMYQQPQQGYGGYQQPSGYGNYGGMQNPYQPQQMGNTNNFTGYGQQQQPAGMF